MLFAAEKLFATDVALAAWQMHAAMHTAHHVFGRGCARRRAARDRFTIAFQHQPGKRDRQHQENQFPQDLPRKRAVRKAAVCITRRLPSRRLGSPQCAAPPDAHGISAASAAVVVAMNGRGERIRTSDSCVPNAVLYQAELHPELEQTSSDKHVLQLRLAVNVGNHRKKHAAAPRWGFTTA